MPGRFEERMGVSWDDGSGYRYGIVMSSDSAGVTVVPVYALDNNMRCCYEGGAIRDRDEHNVRLESCPPPFTLLCAFAGRGNGCYAYADSNAMIHMDVADISSAGLYLIDDGSKISEADMANIRSHPWRDEKQVSRPLSALDRLRSMSPHDEPDREEPGGPEYF